MFITNAPRFSSSSSTTVTAVNTGLSQNRCTAPPSFLLLSSTPLIVQKPLPQTQYVRIETKSAELLGVVNVDGIVIGRAQCPFRIIVCTFQCYILSSSVYSARLKLSRLISTFPAQRTAFLLIRIEFQYTSHHSHTIKYTPYPQTY